MPAAVVRSRLLSLDYSHIEYVLGCMSRTTTKINNIKHYLLTTLYNAPVTIGHYSEKRLSEARYRPWPISVTPIFSDVFLSPS